MDISKLGDDHGACFCLKGAMSFRDKDLFAPVLDAVSTEGGGTVFLDLSGLDHVDSFAIGLFLLAHEQARAAGNRLKVSRPSGDAARVFQLASLDCVLDVQTPPRAAMPGARLGAGRAQGLALRPLPGCADGSPCVQISGRLVFAGHRQFEDVVKGLLGQSGPRIVLDLSELDFMDSAGLSMIVIAYEEAEAQGVRLVLRDPKGAVAQLLNLSALEFMVED